MYEYEVEFMPSKSFIKALNSEKIMDQAEIEWVQSFTLCNFIGRYFL